MSEQVASERDLRWQATLQTVCDWRRGLSSAAAAELRRCRRPEDVELHPEFHRVRRALPSDSPVSHRQLPLLVGLSAHIRADQAGGNAGTVQLLARTLGRNGSEGKPLLSEARFRRLLATEELDALYPALVRVIRHAGGAVTLEALWRGLAWWNTQTRRQWAYAYYENN